MKAKLRYLAAAIVLQSNLLLAQTQLFEHVYILNAPSTSSAGNDSIVGFDQAGHRSTLVASNAALNGIREIEFSADGRVLYALQSNASLNTHRLLCFDVAGNIVDEITGFNGSLHAMTRAPNGLLYVSVHDFYPAATIRLVEVNPVSKTLRTVATYVEHFVGDMTCDADGNLYFTGWQWGGPYDCVFKIEPSGRKTVFADSGDGLSDPFGITYDWRHRKIWVTSVTGGSAYLGGKIHCFELDGTECFQADLGSFRQPQARGVVADDDGLPLIPLGTFDKVVKMDSAGAVKDMWTGLRWPVDIKFPHDLMPTQTAYLSMIGFSNQDGEGEDLTEFGQDETLYVSVRDAELNVADPGSEVTLLLSQPRAGRKTKAIKITTSLQGGSDGWFRGAVALSPFRPGQARAWVYATSPGGLSKLVRTSMITIHAAP